MRNLSVLWNLASLLDIKVLLHKQTFPCHPQLLGPQSHEVLPLYGLHLHSLSLRRPQKSTKRSQLKLLSQDLITCDRWRRAASLQGDILRWPLRGRGLQRWNLHGQLKAAKPFTRTHSLMFSTHFHQRPPPWNQRRIHATTCTVLDGLDYWWVLSCWHGLHMRWREAIVCSLLTQALHSFHETIRW